MHFFESEVAKNTSMAFCTFLTITYKKEMIQTIITKVNRDVDFYYTDYLSSLLEEPLDLNPNILNNQYVLQTKMQIN